MAQYKDVVVQITRNTASLTQENQGLCLILTTESTHAYQEYSSLAAVISGGFASSSQAYKAAAAIFGQTPAVDKVAIVGIELGEDDDITPVIDGLSQVAGSEDFYFFVSNIASEEGMTALATWATSNQIYYVVSIPEALVDTWTNPSSDHVIVLVHDQKELYPEAAWVGKCSTFIPGSATWKFKTLSGIPPMEYDDQATMVAHLNDLNYNTYVTSRGLNMTTNSKCSSGEWIDVMLGVDWIRINMETNVTFVLVNNAKVPYTNAGISQIVDAVEFTLRAAATNQIISLDASGVGEYTIDIPRVADIAPNDIANRELNDIRWTARLAGAIHEVLIRGTVQYTEV